MGVVEAVRSWARSFEVHSSRTGCYQDYLGCCGSVLVARSTAHQTAMSLCPSCPRASVVVFCYRCRGHRTFCHGHCGLVPRVVATVVDGRCADCANVSGYWRTILRRSCHFDCAGLCPAREKTQTMTGDGVWASASSAVDHAAFLAQIPCAQRLPSKSLCFQAHRPSAYPDRTS